MALQIAAGAVGSTLCFFTTILCPGSHCGTSHFHPLTSELIQGVDVNLPI